MTGLLLAASLAFATHAVPQAAPAASTQAPPPRRIAVLEFTGREIEPAHLVAITDRARGGIVDAARLRGMSVMSTENMAVLIDQGGTGKCEEGECEVETARKIGADFVITGRVNRFDKSYSLDLKLLSSKTGDIVKTATFDANSLPELYRGSSDIARDLVQRGIPLGVPGAAGAVAEGSYLAPEKSLPAEGAEEVVVRFDTRPPGALVRVDGVSRCQNTPCVARIPAGPHEATMELVDYDPATRSFEARRDTQLLVPLVPTFGWLTIRTNPEGVLLALNDKEKGRSPFERLEIQPGPITVSVIDPCYLPDRLQKTVVKAQAIEADMEARRKMARLRVTATKSNGEPVDGEVRVDDQVVGPTGKDLRVPICSSQASMKVDGETWVASLKLSETETTLLEARLQPGILAPRFTTAPSRTFDDSSLRLSDAPMRLDAAATKKPTWPYWVGGVGAAIWAGAGAAAIMYHNQANTYPPGDPQATSAVSTGKTMMIVSNVGAAMLLTGVIGWLVSL